MHDSRVADAEMRFTATGRRTDRTPARKHAAMLHRRLAAVCVVAVASAATGANAGAETWDVSAQHGPTRQITIDTREGTWMNVDVSPDGSTIIFDLLGDIYRMPITGGDAVALTSGRRRARCRGLVAAPASSAGSEHQDIPDPIW